MQDQKNESQEPKIEERKPNRKERRTAQSVTRKEKRKLAKKGSLPTDKSNCGHAACRTAKKGTGK